MTHRLSKEMSYRFAKDTVAATMVDPDYLAARLAQIGGPTDEFTRTPTGDGGTSLTIRQAVPTDKVPGYLRGFVGSGLRIERVERWRRDGTATVRAEVPGTPAMTSGNIAITETGADTCVVTVTLDTTISLPLIGGKVEQLVTGQLGALLDLEHEFTVEYLRARV